MTKSNCNIITPFRMLCLNNFPFIEEEFDALDNYQLLSKIVGKLNEVIKNENNLNSNFTNLYNAFTELKNYVDNYFDNLDVQEEINNKLDDMAESGTLEEIIATYLNTKSILCFDNVSSMKESINLIDGSYAETLGYHTKNDGGSALYKIREITNEDVVDEVNIIAIGSDDLIAELILLEANPEIYGAYGDGVHDDTNAIQKMLNENDICKMNKTYLLTDSIVISGMRKIVCCKGKIIINSDVPAVKIEDLQNSDLYFNYIENENSTGSCINLNAYGTNYTQYNKIRFNELRAGTNGKCILITTSNGRWVNENTFIGGRCRTGDWSIYADDTTNDSVAYSCIEGNSFEHIGIEGIAHGFYLGRCWNTIIDKCRYAESSHFITTVGTCHNLTIINKHNANLPKFILSNATTGIMIGGVITDGNIDYNVGTEVYPITNGIITGINHTLYLNITAGMVSETEGIYDMTDIKFPSAPTYIAANYACNTIILPSYYGVKNGINKIELALNETTSRDVTLKIGSTVIGIFGNEIPDYSRIVMEWDTQLGWYYYVVTRNRTS